ncbi:unnamed protein product [Prorocentrum cordatum]|uniref:RNA-dependent RNA polymerase n=1 Tax=Prorocentrum cordatum TaxID=2364126 RepID=A0ABN9W4Q3_9DINO|nr:unnamed protein product [Polarella glacialis]
MALLPRLRLYRAEGNAAEAAEFFNELLPGRVVTVHYGDDRGMWHEREELASGADGDGHDMASLTLGATPARQRPAGRVYRFRAYPTEAELLQLVRAARRAARDADLVVSEPPYYMRDAEVLGDGATVSFGGAPGFYRRMARKAPPPGMSWIAAKTVTGETQKGDEITPGVGDVLWGESGLHGLSSGFIVPMELEVLDDFPLSGERSYEWLFEHIVEHGGTPEDVDQVDGSNLACVEVVARAYQLVEETMGGMKVGGVEHYIGRSNQSARRGVAVAPGLAKCATEQLAKETEIQKQRRKCFNLLGGYTAPQCTPERPSDLGDLLLPRVRGLHRQMEAPAGASAQEACSELSGRPCLHYDTSNDLPLRSDAPRFVSWPNLGNEPGWLADRLGPRDRCSLLDLDHALLLPPRSFDAVAEEGGGPTLYMDPVLERDCALYIESVKSGISRGVFVPGKTRVEGVGVFFVAEDFLIRMVLDCRRSNQRFQPSPPVSLFSAAGFADLEVPLGTSLYFAGVDVQSAFYQRKLPAYLRPLFCLPVVAAGELGVGELDGHRVAPWARLYPQLAAAPMGWSWALYFAQRARERALDQRPPAHSLYVDNALVVGTDREEVARVRQLASQTLEAAGLAVHDESDAAEAMVMLGRQLEGRPARATLAPRRFWKLRLGIGFLLQRRPWVTSRDIDHLLGHCTFAALCRRESLGCFGAVYGFVQQGYQRARPLWASARKELMIFRGILIALEARLDAPWSPQVVVADACETGRASAPAAWGVADVAAAGRWHERWRFRRAREGDGTLRPRDRAARTAAAALLEADPSHAALRGESSKNFPDVSAHYLRRSKWKLMRYVPTFRKVPMHREEARGDLHAVKLILSGADSWGKKHAVFGGNLALALALSKGLRGAAAETAHAGAATGCATGPGCSVARAARRSCGASRDSGRVPRSLAPRVRLARAVGLLTRRLEARPFLPSFAPPTSAAVPTRELLGSGGQARGTTRQLSIAETAALGKRSRHQYRNLLEQFLMASELPTLGAAAPLLDAAVVRFFDELYLAGKAASTGEKLIAAIAMRVPDYQFKGRLRLCRIGGKKEMALYWLLMVDTYLRPGEAFRLTKGQMVPSQAEMPNVTIHISPDYLKRPAQAVWSPMTTAARAYCMRANVELHVQRNSV